MKLSKKVLLIVVSVIFAVALGVLFSIYSGQNGERAELDERLSGPQGAQTILPGLIDEREEKEDELTQAESLLAANQAKFPESVESIEYGDDLFEIADDCNVSLTKLTAAKPTNKTVGTVTYSTSSFRLVVQGSIDNIMEFIYALRTGDDFQLPSYPWSAEINSVETNVSGGSANINLVIYGYEG